MEEQSHYNALQQTTLAFGGSDNGSCYSHVYPDYHFPMTAQNDGNPLVPTTLPHWIYCQPTPQSYVEFISETGACHVQKEIAYCNSPISSGFVPIEASFDKAGFKVNCLQPPNEVAPLNNLTGSEHLVPSQNSNQGYSHAALGFPPKIAKIMPRRKSNVDRCQRAKIAERLEAIQELLPHSKERCKESVMDDIIEHIKYLQSQIKDLTRSRLGGEPSCTPLIFHEGYGRFLLHDQLLNEPLEERIGKLLEVNPYAATQLLESRGLFMMPVALVEGLPPLI